MQNTMVVVGGTGVAMAAVGGKNKKNVRFRGEMERGKGKLLFNINGGKGLKMRIFA